MCRRSEPCFSVFSKTRYDFQESRLFRVITSYKQFDDSSTCLVDSYNLFNIKTTHLGNVHTDDTIAGSTLSYCHNEYDSILNEDVRVAYETIESRAAVDSIAIANSKSVRGTDLSNGDRQRLFLVFRARCSIDVRNSLDTQRISNNL